MSTPLKRRPIRRRADLPPVPYQRWARPLAIFLVLFAGAAVLVAVYFGGASWTSLLGAMLFALIATMLEGYIRRRGANRKSHRRRRRSE